MDRIKEELVRRLILLIEDATDNVLKNIENLEEEKKEMKAQLFQGMAIRLFDRCQELNPKNITIVKKEISKKDMMEKFE